MLASNVTLLVRVQVADGPGKAFGYARLALGRVGEGEFTVTGDIKETEYVSAQDQLLGYITINFKVDVDVLSERSFVVSPFNSKTCARMVREYSRFCLCSTLNPKTSARRSRQTLR